MSKMLDYPAKFPFLIVFLVLEFPAMIGFWIWFMFRKKEEVKDG